MKPQKEWTAEHPNLRKNFSCSRLVGVEWEFNNSNSLSSINRWIEKWGGGKHADGSCGSEMVTPPVAGDHLINCLTELGESFKKDQAQADQTCGIHVHVDARDLGWSDMYKLLRIYSHVEPILYIVGGQNRILSGYCKPCGPAYIKALAKEDCKGEILAVAYSQNGAKNGRQYIRNRPGKKDGGRYRGLNLCPWLCGRRVKVKNPTGTLMVLDDVLLARKYSLDNGKLFSAPHRHVKIVPGNHVVSLYDSSGKFIRNYNVTIKENDMYTLNLNKESQASFTASSKNKVSVSKDHKYNEILVRRMKDATVEFRIHRNTLDSSRVIGWAKLCARLVDWASKASEEDIKNLPKSSLRALCEITPDCSSWIISRVKDWRNATRSDTGIPRRVYFKDGQYKYRSDVQ